MINQYEEYKSKLEEINLIYMKTNRLDKNILLTLKQELFDKEFIDLHCYCIFILSNYLIRTGDYELFIELLSELQQAPNQDNEYPLIYEYILEGTYHWLKNSNVVKCLLNLEKAKLNILKNVIDENLLYYNIIHLIGVVYASNNDNKRAYEYFLEALKCRLSDADNYYKANTYHWIGILESRYFNTDKALDNFLRSLELFKKKELCYNQSQVLNSIGLLYMDLQKYEQAYESYKESLEISRKNNFPDNMADVLNNIGFYYYKINDYKKAEENFILSIEYAKKIQNMHKLGFVKANQGQLYIEIQQYDKAKEILFSAMNLASYLNDKEFTINLHCDLTNFYLLTKDCKNAQKYMNKTKLLANEFGDNRINMKVYMLITKYYEERKQYKEALNYSKKLRELETLFQNSQAQANFEILTIKGKVDKIVDEYEKKIEKEKINAIKAMAVTTSHDINQPLTIMQFSVEMLRRDDMGLEFSKKQLKYVDIIEECIIKITDILQSYNSNENYTITKYIDNIKMVIFNDKEKSVTENDFILPN